MTEVLIEHDWERTGAYHMERDEALARELFEDPGLDRIHLRLYTWKPWALSLGFQQKLESIDETECARQGIDVVRRPTGGRAVLHAEELTYAVIMRTSPTEGLYAAHNRIVEALLAGLRSLGDGGEELQLTNATSQSAPSIRDAYQPGTLTNIACFTSSARHEVQWKGRKVLGSAQRRFGDVTLQHGSIMLGEAHLRLPDFLNLTEDRREQMRSILVRETATLSDVFGRAITAGEAARHIAADFKAHICMSQEVAVR